MHRRDLIKHILAGSGIALISPLVLANDTLSLLSDPSVACDVNELTAPTPNSKFYTNGLVKAYTGCTVICNTDKTSALFLAMLKVQVEAQRLFGDTIVFLPPDSYHMTVIDLVSGTNKMPWPKNTDKNLTMHQATDVIKTMLVNKKLGFNRPVNMQINFDREHHLPDPWDPKKQLGFSMPLKPATDKDANMLKTFRDNVAEITGVRHKNHDRYNFHSTMGYHVREMSRCRREQYMEKYSQWRKLIDQHAGKITFNNPFLSYFPDMYQFDKIVSLES